MCFVRFGRMVCCLVVCVGLGRGLASLCVVVSVWWLFVLSGFWVVCVWVVMCGGVVIFFVFFVVVW